MDLQMVVAWLKRLANLDMTVFEEARNNPGATLPGVLVAAAGMLIAGIGGWLWWVLKDYPAQDDSPLPATDVLVHSGLIGAALATVLWGFIWLVIVYVMLTQVFRHVTYVEQLLRVMGLAAAPMALHGPHVHPGPFARHRRDGAGADNGAHQRCDRERDAGPAGAGATRQPRGIFRVVGALTLLASPLEPHAPGVFLFNSISRIADDILSFAS